MEPYHPPQQQKQNQPHQDQLPPLEIPDEDIRYCLSFLAPILHSTITKLYELDKPGWGAYMELVYQSIDDVMSAGVEEGVI